MKRILSSVIALLVVAYAGLVLWSLHTADIEDVSLCVTEENTHRIPNSVCELYLFQFRGTPSDLEYLKNRAGIAFFFGVENHRSLSAMFLRRPPTR